MTRVLTVIEWPSMGSARRFPLGGFWVVEADAGNANTGPYLPKAGPFRTSAEAREDKRKREEQQP